MFRSLVAALVLFAFVATPAVAGEKIQLGVKAGAKLSFTSKRDSDSKSQRGDRKSTSEAEYSIEVKNVADDGSLTVAVQFAKLKISQTGGRGDFSFDSANADASDGERGAVLKKLAGATITAKIGADGRVDRNLEGLDGIVAVPQGGERGGFRRQMPAGFREVSALRSDLGTIFGAGFQGQELEEGKSYRARRGGERGGGRDGGAERRRRRPGADDGDGENRGRRGRERRRPGADDEARADTSGTPDIVPVAFAQEEEPRRGRRRGQDGDRPRGGGDRGGRGGRGDRGGFGGPAFVFKGIEADLFRFDLQMRSFGRDGGGEPRTIGAASYSKADGLLHSFSSKTSFGSEERGFSFKNQHSIVRAGAKATAAGKADDSVKL